jgi:hypothetical protein
MSYLGDHFAGSSASFFFTTGSTTPLLILVANPYRTGVSFFNDTNQTVYVGFCSGAANMNTTTRFTTKLAAQSGEDIPGDKVYTGPVSVVWQTLPSTGSLVVTEES